MRIEYHGARFGRATELAGLPPTYILTAEIDPLRDDGERFADRLRAADVPVELSRAVGLTHGFMRAQSFSAKVRAETDRLCAALRRHLAA